jgi:hypothetical protein
MFHEITRPFRVFKSQILNNLNVFSLFKNMVNEAKENSDVESNSKAPPVAKNVSKSEFRNRYRMLSIHSSVILFFLLYAILFFVFSLNFVAFLVSGLVVVFFLISYFSSLYKAWLSRYYFRNWDDRFLHANIGIRDFFDDIISSKRLIFPVFNINNGAK